MKAAVLYDFNTPLKIEQFDLPDIEDDQVRVRLEASGVCRSEWSRFDESIMSDCVHANTNTNVTSMMIAEKMAAFMDG